MGIKISKPAAVVGAATEGGVFRNTAYRVSYVTKYPLQTKCTMPPMYETCLSSEPSSNSTIFLIQFNGFQSISILSKTELSSGPHQNWEKLKIT